MACRSSCSASSGAAARRLFAQVVRLAAAELACAAGVQLARDLRGLRPVARALVDGQQGEQRLALRRPCLRACAAPPRRGRAGRPSGSPAPAHAGRDGGRRGRSARDSRCSCTRTARSYSPRRRNRLPEGEVQLGGVGVVLHRLDEGVDGLVLLFVEQEVQAPEVGLGPGGSRCAAAAGRSARRASPARRRSAGPSSSQLRSKSMRAGVLPGRSRARQLASMPGAAARAAHAAVRHQLGTMPSAPMASPAAKAASTTSTSGARHACRRRNARSRPAGCSARRRTG